MKRNITALFMAGLTLFAGCMIGCKKQSVPDGSTPAPTDRLTLDSKQPIDDVLGTLNPIDPATGYVGKTNEEGELVCQAEFIRVNYDDSFLAPEYIIVKDVSQFQKKVLSRPEFDNTDKAWAGLYDDAYFENHAVIAVALPYTSGSIVTTLYSVRPISDTVEIRLTTNRNDGLGHTDDMAMFYGIIGLDNSVFGRFTKYKIYLDDVEVVQKTTSRVENK